VGFVVAGREVDDEVAAGGEEFGGEARVKVEAAFVAGPAVVSQLYIVTSPHYTKPDMLLLRKTVAVASALVAFTLVSSFFATAESAASQSGESLLRTILIQQQEAWNRGDGIGFAKAFSDDSDFINVRGDVFHGHAEIAARHTAILSGPFKGSHLSLSIRQLTFLGPDVALIETDHELTNFEHMVPGIAATAPGVLRTHMKYIAVKRDGEWWFVAAQNTAVLPTIQQQNSPVK
jgi:uncharacterized protein (TIGR02246 family)